MKIKLSKSQWNFIGKTTGWLRVSSSTMVYHASSDDNSMKIKLSKNHWKWIGKKAGWTDGVNKPPLNPQPTNTTPTNTTPTNTTPTNTDPSNTAPENTEARVGKAVGSRYQGLTEKIDQILAEAFDKKTPPSLCSIPNFCVQGSIPRLSMPNFVNAQDINAFKGFLQQNGISIQEIGGIDPNLVWNSQTNVVTDIIAKYAKWDANISVEENIKVFEKNPPRTDGDPVIISTENGNSGYILDGHHRWAYAKVYNELIPGKKGTANFGPVIKVGLPIKDLIQFGLNSPMAARKSDMDDTLKMGDKDKGIKWIVLNQGGKRQVQDAYIDMSNQYIENGKVLGKFEENGNIRGKTGIFLNSMNEKPPMPKLSYFLNNHIGKIS